MSEENEIKVGDLVGFDLKRKPLFEYSTPLIGLVFHIEAGLPMYNNQIHFIDQRTGKKEWFYRRSLIKLNKPAD